MGWNNDDEIKKKGSNITSKILLAIIGCIILIIAIIIMILANSTTKATYTISVDGVAVNTVSISNLLDVVDDATYVNIKEFAKLVGYEYHEGEYKAYAIEDNKCYVQGTDETASFYVDTNKVYKLPVNLISEDYREYTVQSNIIKNEQGGIYAPIDAIALAFNVDITEQNNGLVILTLDYLVSVYDTKTIKWGYTGMKTQSFENKKAILYDCLIVKKEEGLYKIIDKQNTKEIVSDKYSAIEFSENTKEFFVTNSLNQVGIINLDGTIKIEPVYETISVLDKESDLYLIEKDKKYGVVKSGNVSIIFPEYDSIGYENTTVENSSSNQQLLLDELIPVSKNGIWGAFNKEGKKVLELTYSSFGCSLTSIIIDETTVKQVEPVLSIERCKGIVVKKDGKYGLVDVTGNELVPIVVDCIYGIEKEEEEDKKYFMLYNDQELNIIERLIKAGKIEENIVKEEEKNDNQTENNTTTVSTNTVNEDQNTANSNNNIENNQNVVQNNVNSNSSMNVNLQ